MSEVSTDAKADGDSVTTLSIVVPAYNEEGNLRTLVRRLAEALPFDLSWEVIFVDDGSCDATWLSIEALSEKDGRVKGVRLARNFGHQYALFAGLSYAEGEAIVMMDADLQHPPNVVPILLEKWREGAMIVHTIRHDTGTEPFLKRITSKAFYRVFTFLSGIEIRPGMADFRLIDRLVLNSLLEFKEEGLFLRGLLNWVGFESAEVEFVCGERLSGSSSYTFKKMVQLAWNGIASFSVVPLRLGILLGFLTSLVAFAELGYVIYMSQVVGATVPGWASAISVTTLLFGVLFIFLGVIAEYIGRILIEVRARPRFITSELVGLPQLSSRRSRQT